MYQVVSDVPYAFVEINEKAVIIILKVKLYFFTSMSLFFSFHRYNYIIVKTITPRARGISAHQRGAYRSVTIIYNH